MTPREVSSQDEFMHWLCNKLKEWDIPQDGRIYETDREIGAMHKSRWIAKEVREKLSELRIDQ